MASERIKNKRKMRMLLGAYWIIDAFRGEGAAKATLKTMKIRRNVLKEERREMHAAQSGQMQDAAGRVLPHVKAAAAGASVFSHAKTAGAGGKGFSHAKAAGAGRKGRIMPKVRKTIFRQILHRSGII